MFTSIPPVQPDVRDHHVCHPHMCVKKMDENGEEQPIILPS